MAKTVELHEPMAVGYSYSIFWLPRGRRLLILNRGGVKDVELEPPDYEVEPAEPELKVVSDQTWVDAIADICEAATVAGPRMIDEIADALPGEWQMPAKVGVVVAPASVILAEAA